MLRPNPTNRTICTQNYHTSGLSSFTLSSTNTDAMSAANELGENWSSKPKRKSKRMSLPIEKSEHRKRLKRDMSEKIRERVILESGEMSEKGGGRETPDRVGKRLAEDGQFDVG
jgi:hypothetical protein